MISIKTNFATQAIKEGKSAIELLVLIDDFRIIRNNALVSAQEDENLLYDLETVEEKKEFIDYCYKRMQELKKAIEPLENEIKKVLTSYQQASHTYGHFIQAINDDLEITEKKRYFGIYKEQERWSK